MKKSISLFSLLFLVTLLFAGVPGMKKGTPEIKSISTLEFNAQGILFIGDSKSASVFAIDLEDNTQNSDAEALNIVDLEGDMAGLLGTSRDNVLIHDMAVNPISQNVYISVSRGRAKWNSKWDLPNDLADAVILMKISPTGDYSEVSLNDVAFSSITINNPVSEDKTHRWKKGVPLRVDAITDLVYDNGKVYITGLSNEEFSSSMWIAPFPFNKEVSTRSLEIYHGAHGKWETNAPIRTFLPYNLNGKQHLLAAYLCTPLVSFETKALEDAKHIKGRTIAEFGSGNFPTDMLVYQNNDKDYILMSNSQLPLLVFSTEDVANFEGEIVDEVKNYTAGVDYTSRSGSGVQQLSNFNEKFLLATQRMPSGKLALVSLAKAWLIP
jgi:hypothetical protein